MTFITCDCTLYRSFFIVYCYVIVHYNVSTVIVFSHNMYLLSVGNFQSIILSTIYFTILKIIFYVNSKEMKMKICRIWNAARHFSGVCMGVAMFMLLLLYCLLLQPLKILCFCNVIDICAWGEWAVCWVGWLVVKQTYWSGNAVHGQMLLFVMFILNVYSNHPI